LADAILERSKAITSSVVENRLQLSREAQMAENSVRDTDLSAQLQDVEKRVSRHSSSGGAVSVCVCVCVKYSILIAIAYM